MTYRELIECDVPGCNAQDDAGAMAPRFPPTWAQLSTPPAAAVESALDAHLDLCQAHARGVLEYLGLVPNVLDPESGDPECDHPNQTGIDMTPLNDPAKIWRCDGCKAIIHPESGDPS